MSGGVDSSAAAAMLIEQGYEVAGATMKLWEKGDYFDCEEVKTPVSEARKVADELGIQHYVFDFSDEFRKEVVIPFAKAYEEGKTPNPCVLCNKNLKFGEFLDRALEMGFDYIATGHYACVKKNDDGTYSLISENDAKDQTYVLYNLNQHILSHLLLPVGGKQKDEIRRYSQKSGLSSAESPDSQDICFIPDNDYCKLLSRLGIKSKSGNFINMQGNIIGQHNGIINYTVGQRKGLGSFGSPKYVVSLDALKNQVILGENSDLFRSELMCKEVNWLSGKYPEAPIKAQVKIRYSAKAADAVIVSENNCCRIKFETPQRAITKGQSAVFYDGCTLLGGGIIE